MGRYQVQQSIKDFRFVIMCSNRVFKHEGMLVALGRDVPQGRGGLGGGGGFAATIARRLSFDTAGGGGGGGGGGARRGSVDSHSRRGSVDSRRASAVSLVSISRRGSTIDDQFVDGGGAGSNSSSTSDVIGAAGAGAGTGTSWEERKERAYMVFLFHDILIFCKPSKVERGRQMYEKRGLLAVRRVIDCCRDDDPTSSLVFRVYGTVVELHPKLLWTQVRACVLGCAVFVCLAERCRIISSCIS